VNMLNGMIILLNDLYSINVSYPVWNDRKKCVFRHVRNNLNVTYVYSMFFGTCRSQATETVTGAER